ncbi:MAG: serine/threonine-protein kinase [Polaromonas sp.]|uniref:CHASE2 domain-containing serine/threonine-protein kinase n=1 Tax=Polaromonas sp. TaxID=1869339 RepID=UPI002733FDF5|nr:serine/threonine-protein kinase [Polaromonas sp.]MDP2819844.1 serine/threonine-protein kinase [Polaromonas sp.]
MATSSSKRRQFWRADWFVGVLVVLAVLVLHSATDFFGALERRYYDFASTSTSRQPSDRIAIIAIDDQSIANIGRWPWSRDVHAQLIDQLTAAKVKTIAHTAFFFEPQTDRGLVFIRKIKEALGPAVDPVLSQGGLNEQLGKVIADAEVALDTDAKLATSMTKAGNVLVPSVFVLGEPQGKPDHPLPAYALKSAVEETGGFSLPAVRGQQPIEIIGNSAAGVAHLNQLPNVDGAVRQEPLLINYYGKAVPSMGLLAAVKSLNLDAPDIKLNGVESVQIGKLRIGTDEAALMLPQFYKGRDGKPAFTVDSFYDVLSGKIPASKYTDKIVVIGATAAGVGTQFPTPAGPGLSPAETIAHITSSILSEHFIALAYAHKQNVVHRDIKPANIMYDPESDTVKVTDFGIARITDSSKTKTGMVLGTPSFMSPEQIAGKKVDGRSDMYSLGVMLFQMLAGVLPFRGDSMAELMYKIANEPAPDIRIIRQELSGRLADIVALSLSKKSEARYQEGEQFAADLRVVIAELSGAVTSPPFATALQAAGASDAGEKTAVLAAEERPLFEKTVVTQTPFDAAAGHAEKDLKP